MKFTRLLCLSLLVAVAGCGDQDAGAEGERKTAAGEVLGGSISDDMLPLDTVTSQSPPLRDTGEGAQGGDDANALRKDYAPNARSEPAASAPAAEPAPGPSAAPTPETDSDE